MSCGFYNITKSRHSESARTHLYRSRAFTKHNVVFEMTLFSQTTAWLYRSLVGGINFCRSGRCPIEQDTKSRSKKCEQFSLIFMTHYGLI